MARIAARRLLQLLLVLLGISFLTFMLTYLAPGDPAELMLTAAGTTPTPQLVEQVRDDMGLNKPVLVRYGEWLSAALGGDFGISYKYNQPVMEIIAGRLPATFKLAGASLLIMLITALPLGLLSALYRNRAVDYLIRLFSFLGISMPGFWIALLLIYFFSLQLKILPVMGDAGGMGIVLPAATLAIAMTSKYTRQLRAVILEEISQDYVIGARARGIKERTILLKHVLQNSLLPVITLLGLSLGSLLGGTAIVETIFVWPGVGKLAVDAIFTRDYPLIQGYVVWMAIIYVLINILVDISYFLLDPRINRERAVE